MPVTVRDRRETFQETYRSKVYNRGFTAPVIFVNIEKGMNPHE